MSDDRSQTTEPRCAGTMLWNGEDPPTVCPRCGATEDELCHDFAAQEAQWKELIGELANHE